MSVRPQNKNLRPNAKGQRRGGRQKGTPNKITVQMKEAVLNVFNKIGGEDGMARWAKGKGNRKAFYGIASKLIPQELTGAGGSPLIPVAEVHAYIPANNRPAPGDADKS